MLIVSKRELCLRRSRLSTFRLDPVEDEDCEDKLSLATLNPQSLYSHLNGQKTLFLYKYWSFLPLLV